MLTRRAEHARALKEHGLRVSGRSDFTARLAAATDPDDLPEPELVIVACKGTDLEPLARRLAGHFPAATVMTVQNGLGAEEIVGAHGDWPLLSSVTFMSGTRHADDARRVRPRHGDLDRAVPRHDRRRRACGRGADRLVRPEGGGASTTCVPRSGRS